MKRKSALAVAGAFLAMFAVAIPVGAQTNVFDGSSNDFCYTCNSGYDFQKYNRERAIAEPGQTNKTQNGAPRRFRHSDDPNFQIPGK
jgi:hypothetical protein